jgi:hypothetical protein
MEGFNWCFYLYCWLTEPLKPTLRQFLQVAGLVTCIVVRFSSKIQSAGCGVIADSCSGATMILL